MSLQPGEPSLNPADDEPEFAARIHSVPSSHTTTATLIPGSREECASEIIANVLRAAHRLRGLLATHFSTFGLSDVRFEVLRIVRDNAPLGCTQSEVASRLDQSESSVSALIERMRESNLIYRLHSKTDRRKRVLILTELGRHMLADAEQNHGKRAAQLLAKLEPSQLEQLANSLRVLCDELAHESESEAATAPERESHYLRAAEHVDPTELHRHRPVA